jgi:hypothetical protein
MHSKTLTAGDFARLTGRAVADVESLMSRFDAMDLRYRDATPEEAARIAAEVDTVLREKDMRKSGSNDSSVWQRGWGEVAAKLAGEEITLSSLRPQYYPGEQVCRLFGRYVFPLVADFEFNVGNTLRRLIYDEFLKEVSTAVEFGCGTGLNLFLLSQLHPEMRLIGCDWATPSRDILSMMARQTGHRIEGHVFNMLTADGWNGAVIDRSTAVLTITSMEQLSTNWQEFAAFIMARNAAIYLHVEPFYELYGDTPHDELARRYHRKRDYLQGYLPYVEALAQSGKAEILATRRIAFGGLYHEAYSILVWRPKV